MMSVTPPAANAVPDLPALFTLTAAVRAGKLSAAQRDRLVELLIEVDTAAMLCKEPRYSDSDNQARFAAMCWERVGPAYAELLEAPGGRR